MQYTAAFVVDKLALSTKKEKGEDGESYEIPHLVVTLTLTNEAAINAASRLAAFQGQECTVEVAGNGRQLSLA